MKAVAVWKGTLSFGLVSINIELYSAVPAHSMGFNLLHEKCHTPVNYKRICPTCKVEVEWSAIVKGLKLEDGSYFIITKENLEKLKPEKTDALSIIQFVKTEQVHPIYFDQHYYILPAKLTEKAFFLFQTILTKKDMIAIGQFVMRDKQYICAIQPCEKVLLLTTLHYEYEIRKLTKIHGIKMPKFSTTELQLGTQLVDTLTAKTFDMHQFKDTFAQELKKRIAQAAKGKNLEKIKKAKKKKEEITDHASLIQVLRKSIKSPHPTAYARAHKAQELT